MARKLTGKQEAFCVAYIKLGKSAEAFRQAYDTSNWSHGAVKVQASKMLRIPGVAARIEELRRPVAEAAKLTLATHLRSLEELRDEARDDGQLSAAVVAEVSRGKASGLYVDRKEIRHGPLGELTDEQLDQLFTRFIAELAPEDRARFGSGRADEAIAGESAAGIPPLH